MIRVIYRLRAPDLTQEALARSWREAMSAICAKENGALGGDLLRSETDPSEYLVVTRWKSVEAWRDFWSKGPPEPQGDPAQNELFSHVDTFEAKAEVKATTEAAVIEEAHPRAKQPRGGRR